MNNNEFWDKQAQKHHSDVKAVNFDVMANELESFYINKYIGEPASLVDLGCGNGNTLIYLAKNHPLTRFVGIDYSKGMIDAANEQKIRFGLDNVDFICKDVTGDLSEFTNNFNIVLSKRLFINLPNSVHKKVIENIYSLVNPWYGALFLVECFIEPLNNINKIRKSLGYSEIKVHSFNKYLTMKYFDKIKDYFFVSKKIDFNSLYYFISRIFNDGGNYNDSINKTAVDISKELGCFLNGFSPEILYIMNIAEPGVFGTCDCLEEVVNYKGDGKC